MRRYPIDVFLVSLAVLAAELGIIRYLSAASWANFAAMIISIAMLGFGLSGVVMTLYKERIERHLEAWSYWSAFAFVVLSGLVFFVARAVPFLPQSLHQDSTQLVYLGLYYLLYLLPLLAGAFFINLSFLRMKREINRLYFFNMLGSGVGAVLILFLMSWMAPQYLMLPAVALGGGALLLSKWGKPALRFGLAALAVALAVVPYFGGVELTFSDYKDISYAMKAPDAKVIEARPSPMGYLQVVESGQFRFAPGLSLAAYDVDTPVQHGLFVDGSSQSGLARLVTGNDARFVRALPFALPFELKKNPDVLVLGIGAGNPVLYAHTLGAKTVVGVEPNPPILDLARGKFAGYARGLWSVPGLSVEIADPRSFCHRTDKTFDILCIPALDSSGMSVGSGAGNGENYLFTREAVADYLKLVRDDGFVYFSISEKEEPKRLLKLQALVFSYLKETYPKDWSRRVVFVRGMDWGVLLVKDGLFTDAEIAVLKQRAEKLSFDLSYYPGIKAEEVNRFNLLADDLYYKFALAYQAGTEQEFIGSYFFHIKPPTDDNPYFDRMLRASTLPRLFGFEGGLKSVPTSEWSYLLSWGTLLQGVLFSLVLILFPVFAQGKRFLKERGKRKLIGYFFALGAGFMLIEIAVIQKLTLFISNPLYSTGLVIATLLIASSIGAHWAQRFSSRPLDGIKIGVAGIIGSLLLFVVAWSPLMSALLGMPDLVRILVAIVVLAPLGFFMGFPFPLGLQVLSDKREVFLPWALAINGSVSVFASVLTTILSMHLGFTVVFACAAACYLLAYATFPGRIAFGLKD